MRNIEGVQVVYVQRRVCTTDVLYLLLEAAARIVTENTLYSPSEIRCYRCLVFFPISRDFYLYTWFPSLKNTVAGGRGCRDWSVQPSEMFEFWQKNHYYLIFLSHYFLKYHGRSTDYLLVNKSDLRRLVAGLGFYDVRKVLWSPSKYTWPNSKHVCFERIYTSKNYIKKKRENSNYLPRN